MTLISVEELEQALILLKEWRLNVQKQNEIVLPWPPSVNRYWRTFQGRMIISQEGRAYREAVTALLMDRGVAPIKGKLIVEI